MRVRLLVATSVIIGAAAAFSPASAAAFSPASAASTPVPSTAPHVLSLRSAFQRALVYATTGSVAGVVPPIGGRAAEGSRPASSRRAASVTSASASCTEPECDVSYGGGPVQLTPRIYLLLWGPDWSTTSPAAQYLASFYSGLGVAPDDTWSTTTSQYTDSSGGPTFGTSEFGGTYQDTSAPPDPVTPDDVAAEADALVASQHITDVADAQIVVASQSGTCFSDGFVGNCGHVSTGNVSGYCAWHAYDSKTGVAFINLPYLLDAGSYCGENWINAGSAGTYDGFSMVGGHEYAETITDPDPFTGWSDPNDTISDEGAPGEIADKCQWGGSNYGLSLPEGDVTLSTGTFAMQSLWSNAAGECVMTTVPGITLAPPGFRKNTLGKYVSLKIHASTSTGTALHFSASGLPPGLSINSASGVISGRPDTTAGTWRPTVTVTDSVDTARVTFTWQLSSTAGPVTGYAAKCADDYSARTSDGNKIDLWSCDHRARQRFTFTAEGELTVQGDCVTAHGSAVLEPCTDAPNQVWTRRANGEYVVKSDARCLTDPGDATGNGTQLALAVCTDARAQRWSLP